MQSSANLLCLPYHEEKLTHDVCMEIADYVSDIDRE